MTERPAARTLALAAAAVVCVTGLGAGVHQTLAQRQVSEFAAAEITVTVDVVFDVEGSVDGQTWSDDPAAALPAQFRPESMALQVGEAHAVFAPMYLRTTADSTAAGVATLRESGLPTSGFPDALRTRVYSAADECSAAGIANDAPIADGPLRGVVTEPFEIPAPEEADGPGAAQSLCVEVWLDNNDFLLGGERSEPVTAEWVIEAEAQRV